MLMALKQSHFNYCKSFTFIFSPAPPACKPKPYPPPSMPAPQPVVVDVGPVEPTCRHRQGPFGGHDNKFLVFTFKFLLV